MLRINSLVICSAFVLGSSAALAKVPTVTDVTNNHYEFSIAALALKPGANNLNYVIYNKELPAQSPGWTEKELKPNYGPAFELGARYYFSPNNDINLDWTHLYSSTSDSTTAPDASYFLGPDYQIGPDSIPLRNATSNVQFRYDVINLDVGQQIDFGSHFGTRLFLGLSNGFLREQIVTTYSGNVLTGSYQGPTSTQQTVKSYFTGVGPRLGLEARYTANNGFGLLGEAAASALIGSSYSKTNYLSSAQQLISTFGQQTNAQGIWDQNITQVIPGLDAKLGLFYKHAFNRGEQLTLEAGYQAAVYINAINQYLPQTLVQATTTGGIYVASMNHTQSNYSVQGPFLKLAIAV